MYFIGQAVDIHQLKKSKNSTIILGGYRLENQNYKIIAHSDGDIVLHAISNAILGAIQLGDIGDYFKDTDQENKNLDSVKILNFALEKLKEFKLSLANVDLTIICENILLNDHKKLILESLKKLLDLSKINVKATRYEEKKDMIQCHATVLVYK